ncbi:hypothetical protein [Vibrio mediterranei]|uniref:hypothetical protein n=1 Tax=Vibrio mediterranei TaxID=689 RepID=UPI004069816C
MYKWITVPVLLFGLAGHASASIYDKDKQLHVGVSAAMGTSFSLLSLELESSLGYCLAVGTAKELYDMHSYGVFDHHDLAFDFLGCAAGVAIGEVLSIPLGIERGTTGDLMLKWGIAF